jgi:hypothetical protein
MFRLTWTHPDLKNSSQKGDFVISVFAVIFNSTCCDNSLGEISISLTFSPLTDLSYWFNGRSPLRKCRRAVSSPITFSSDFENQAGSGVGLSNWTVASIVKSQSFWRVNGATERVFFRWCACSKVPPWICQTTVWPTVSAILNIRFYFAVITLVWAVDRNEN